MAPKDRAPLSANTPVISTNQSAGEYLEIFRRRRLFIALTLLAILGLGALYSALQTERYRSSSTVLFRSEDSETLFPTAGTFDEGLRRNANAEVAFARSEAYRNQVSDSLPDGAEYSLNAGLEAKERDTFGESVSIVFTATSEDSETAANAATAAALQYITMRHDQDVADFEREIERLDSELSVARQQLADLQAPLQALDLEIQAATDPTELAALLTQRSALNATTNGQVTRFTSRIDRLTEQLNQLLDAESVVDQLDSSAVLTQTGEEPDRPFQPNWIRNLALAAVFGAFMAFAGSVLRDSLDTRIRGESDLDKVGVDRLGRVPAARQIDDMYFVQGSYNLKGTRVADSFRSIVTTLQWVRSQQRMKTLQITSAEPGDGKTTVAVHVAISFANFGEKVIVVDADLRRPRVRELLSLADRESGLTTILQGTDDIDDVVVQHPSGINVIPAGPAVDKPSELLGGPAFFELIKNLEDEYSVVMIDSPPILSAPDAKVIAHTADGVIMIARANHTTRRALSEAIRQLRHSNAVILGSILNRHKPRSHHEAYEKYDYYVDANRT